ncbi:MAG TPA: FecR domain-containing protein [Gemmatimonadaceae bacterium]
MSSADDASAIAAWAAGDAAREQYLETARVHWLATGTVPARFDVDRAWSALDARIAVADGSARAPRATRSRVLRLHPAAAPRVERSFRRLAAPLAAALLVIAAGGTLAWPYLAKVMGARVADVPVREYWTGRGQRTEILLADGTRVTLSVDSRLRIPATYGAHTRDIQLEGEAFFQVRHDPRRPFRVYTGSAVTEDLGTAFAVRAYQGDTATTVIVTEGRVALRADSAAVRHVTLAGGQVAHLDRAGNIAVERAADVDTELAWMQGRLTFQLAPLGDVVHTIERWYDVDITFSDSSLAAVPLTATFTGKPLDDVLDVIGRALDLRYTRTGSHVQFAPARHTR